MSPDTKEAVNGVDENHPDHPNKKIDKYGYFVYKTDSSIATRLDKLIETRTREKDVLKTLKNGGSSLKNVIFNHRSVAFEDQLDDDRLRAQFKITSTHYKDLPVLMEDVRTDIIGRLGRQELNFGKYSTVMQPAVLLSLPGCKRQLYHADYNKKFFFGREKVSYPLGFLYSYEGCKLDIVDGSIDILPFSTDCQNTINAKVANLSKTTITLGPGEMLVFRGDLIHAGSTYDKLNKRLHGHITWSSRVHIHDTLLCEDGDIR